MGFDMVPRLSNEAVDTQKWLTFIQTIKVHFKDDELVSIKPNYIEFEAGEHPQLPFEGHKLLRFSSKVSGSHCQGVEDYIVTVTEIACDVFGSRIHRWHEGFDASAFYRWPEVNDSIKSYKQVGFGMLSETIDYR